MIQRVWSDLPDFREAVFRDGFNVVLADRGEDSTETESTNGLGKTTLLRIIHFALGADLSRDKVLSHPDLVGTRFGIDLQVNGLQTSVSRNTATPRLVRVTKTFVEGLPIETQFFSDTEVELGVEDWRKALSAMLTNESVLQSNVLEYSPTFRELAYYFVRVGKEAFIDPQVAHSGQSGQSKRSVLTYLLGLNLRVQRDLHAKIEERDRVAKAIKALKEAAVEQESIGDLEAERVVLEHSLAERKAAVETFNLRSDYHELEQRLDASDRKLHDLINDNHSDRRLLQYYQDNAADVPLFDAGKPAQILADAGGLFLPEALRTLDEVAKFHEQVRQNRAGFLADEIARLKSKVFHREREISEASEGKTGLLRLLASSGALETLIELQRTVTDLHVSVESIKSKIDERKRFDRRQDELSEDISHARKLLKQDLDDRRETVDEAIALFAEYTRELYGVPGKLSVDVQDHGYRCTFAIDRQGSDGVDQMVVFCFDLLVATLGARRGRNFRTLVHDSSLFADVDPRQYGLALQLAARVSKDEGFQYICCLNAGALPIGHLGEFDLSAVTSLRLTDSDEKGRLLGRRLPQRER